jgi:cell division protein FtsW (lipid II flippase)
MTLQNWSWFTKPMPHGWLVFGVCLIFLGVVYTCMGESYERFYGWIYRSKEPKEFWWSVATYYLLGIFFIVADVFELPRDFLLGVLFIGVFVYLVYLLIRWVIRQKR